MFYKWNLKSFTAAALFFPALILAGGPEIVDVPVTHHQVYVGFNGGLLQADFNVRYPDLTTIIPQHFAVSLQQQGYTAGGSIGYNYLTPNYFFGIQFLANYDWHNVVYAISSFWDTLAIENHFDLAITPGIMLTDTVASYIKLGGSWAWISDSIASPVGFVPVYTNYSVAGRRAGFVAGLGAEKFITKQITLFAEYNFHDYGNVHFLQFQNFAATCDHYARVYSHTITVGASFNIY